MAEVQLRLKAGDRGKVAEVLHYPLRVNIAVGKPLMVKDRAAMVRDVEKIFPAKTVAAALAANPRALFCKAEGVMLGDGVVWATNDAKKRLGVSAINP